MAINYTAYWILFIKLNMAYTIYSNQLSKNQNFTYPEIFGISFIHKEIRCPFVRLLYK